MELLGSQLISVMFDRPLKENKSEVQSKCGFSDIILLLEMLSTIQYSTVQYSTVQYLTSLKAD